MGTLRLRELVLPQQPIQSIPHDMCIGIYMYTHPMVHAYRHVMSPHYSCSYGSGHSVQDQLCCLEWETRLMVHQLSYQSSAAGWAQIQCFVNSPSKQGKNKLNQTQCVIDLHNT